jgi:hypothetical protein
MEKQGLLGRRQSEQRGLANMRHLRCVAQRMLQRNVMRRESEGLIYNFLADSPLGPNTRIMSGHDSGTITPALAEADDVERERWHSQMGEPYRTLLGHFRHEVGHCFWDRLVRDQRAEQFVRRNVRRLHRDYNAALHELKYIHIAVRNSSMQTLMNQAWQASEPTKPLPERAT